jgi:hypothetical protein
MAGTGIRCWELARVLSAHCEVTLAAPGAPSTPSAGDTPKGTWRTVTVTLEDPAELDPLLPEADVVISSALLLRDYPQLGRLPVPWVVDAYVPSPTESLALNRLGHWTSASTATRPTWSYSTAPAPRRT